MEKICRSKVQQVDQRFINDLTSASQACNVISYQHSLGSRNPNWLERYSLPQKGPQLTGFRDGALVRNHQLVAVMAWQTGDGTVIERIHDDGEEYGVSPKAGDELQINYELSLKSTGQVLDSRQGMDFRTGDG